MKRVRLIYFNDWTAMYLDGVLLYENHSISARDFMETLQAHGAGTCLDFKAVSADPEDDRETTMNGCCPDDLKDLKRTKT